MKHLKAIGIKFVFTAIVLLCLFTLFANAEIWEVLIIALAVTVVSYLLGDLLILPKTGHLPAAISDFVLSFLLIWLAAIIITSANDGLLLTALVSAMVLTFCEALFHSHMSNHVVNVKGSKSPEERDREEKEVTHDKGDGRKINDQRDK